MPLDKKVASKLAQLIELMNDPGRKEGSVLRIYHELFLLTDQGRDLPSVFLEWLNDHATLFLCPELLRVLFKLRLEMFSFDFVAINLTDIDDVIDDLTYGNILESILPAGALVKLKRELLRPLQHSPGFIHR